MKMTALAAVLAGTALTTAIMSGSPAEAADIACDTTYTVVSGDSLSGIAARAYGSTGSFQIIYSANAETIGGNPALIKVGQQLTIPCLEATTASTAATDTIREEETTEALPAPDDRQIRFVTATDWAPFSNEDQEQGGMMTEVVNVAMAAADGEPDYKIDFINDWGSHMRPLISDHAYDMTFPWFRPNCDVVDKLGDGSKFRCNNLDWSDPLYEQVVGWYTRATDPAPANHAELSGKTLCRPAGYATFMMEEHGLVEPNITLVRPSSPAECFSGLVEGKFDGVVITSDVAEDAIAATGTADQVRFNDALSQVATLHAVIAKTHPDKERILEKLNSGIAKINTDQRWFEIVKRHLAEHAAKSS